MTATASAPTTTTVVTGRAAAGTRRHAGERRKAAAAWGFLAPFLLAFLLFLVWPLLHGLYLSFTNQSLTGAGGAFVGFANYAEALTDPVMWRSLGNTAWFTILSTVPLVLVALVMALLVHRGLPGQWLWRLSFFLPYLLASTVISQIWVWIFNPQIGAANRILESFGLEPLAWLQSPDTNMYAIVIATVWWTVGFNFLLYLAALQNIPEQQYEAASLDGAGPWRQLWSITLPQLGQVTVLIVILQILASLKLFDQAYQMLGGIASDTTRSIVQYIYEAGFVGYRFGYSAAISYVFFAIIVIIGVIQAFALRRRGEQS
ncbi:MULTISPECIES: carbohydrate ABC transporter permease [Microbacterium]|uniref:Sugar ABC transporter permease n=1 Tax=Microbacterium wangchenii TaxID=2541726 RepID=A0ABX5SZG3_9MICO|nr:MULTISPECIES: sugar ABC transporter permease [Microbacterium]MCK6065898.1 sugar ABC transporter permease [Microbacterium sp. EYE_512]QBR90200.1 sugar ABC transporter permease [Microbacterium wangchenii]TFV84990.1 sugar ABC transporter permease [Microbacterium sp. dk485]TXK11785.1 sugar ABC transporter permease [Microbacterium wangchenii]